MNVKFVLSYFITLAFITINDTNQAINKYKKNTSE
jgi:hypothetical protein